ncbi:D-aminoacyl-tRNA deacylase 1 isoform X1 [Phyllostomus hastatus]|uniref:D-aminoacyl-tRNA deacylase 1 isoform X1 n=1 Tax=Phyllostomus hastatus TaxID=9423 RepID=UPI001E684EDB|nr:D-aminoacyl-tRNA deacylase 1 isoform X1 [Phyllostomus hastatus]
MKAVVQRVARASVTVGGEQISAIGQGICVLLGISLEDTHKELEHMVRKILNLRVFEDESGKHWSKSVMDKQYEVLCVSQFTLQCVLKGNKPDFHLAMPTEQAENFYNSFLEQLRKAYRPELIKDGKFGAYMQVHIQNDGPVTIELESPAPSAATSDPKQAKALGITLTSLQNLCILQLEALSTFNRLKSNFGCQSLKNNSRGKKRPEPKGLLNQAKKEMFLAKKTAVPAVGLRVTCLLNGNRRLQGWNSVHYYWMKLDSEKFMKDAKHLYCFKNLELKCEKEDRNKKSGT